MLIALLTTALLQAPGTAILVAREGRVLTRQATGLADLERRTPITAHTNFRLASVTKGFTAALVVSLAREGRLHLDSAIAAYLPALGPTARRVTVRQLLAHTGGLHDYEDFVPDTAARQVSDADVERLLSRLDTTDFPPGSRYAYSNSGYVILGRVAEAVGGAPFRDLVRTRLFAPAGLIASVAHTDGITTVRDRAFGHTRRDGRWIRTDQSPTSATLGDGGIYSSVDDLYRWSRALDTDAVLDSAGRAVLFTSGVLTPARAEGDAIASGTLTGYGAGWRLDVWRGLRRQSHTGTSIGFRNAIVRFPDQDAVVIVLSNRSDTDAQAVADSLAARLFFGEGDAAWRTPAVAPPPAPPLPSFRSVHAPSPDVVWAGGTRGTVLRSLDGGRRFELRTVPGAEGLDFRGIAGIDGRTAYAMAAGPGERGQGRIYKTDDGGSSWRLVFDDSTTGLFLDGIAMWDATHGLAFSDAVDGRLVILRTEDGERWRRVDPARIPAARAGEGAFAASNSALTVFGDRHAWIVTGAAGPTARVFRSSDQGRTWQVAETPVPAGPTSGLFGIAFRSPTHGIAVGGDYRIAVGRTDVAIGTTDGGRHWRVIDGPRPDGLTTGVTHIRGTQDFLSVGPLGTARWTAARTTTGRRPRAGEAMGLRFVRGDTVAGFSVTAPAADRAVMVGPRLTIRTRATTP